MREVIARIGEKIPLGRRGENMATCVLFDISEWQNTFGEGTVQLIHQRNGDTAPYPSEVEQIGSSVRWCITGSDVDVAGAGIAELQYYVGDVLVKSETYTTYTKRAMGAASEKAPKPHKAWVDKVLNAAAETEKNAELVLRHASAYKPAYPKLDDDQINQMRTLWEAYLKTQKDDYGNWKQKNNNFYYWWDAVPNTYAHTDENKPFDAEGRTPMSCATFVQMIWGGISPDTFVGKKNDYDATIATAFDWGYDFRFPLRPAAYKHKKIPEGYDGINDPRLKPEQVYVDFVQPNKNIDPNDFKGSYSANTYYTTDSEGKLGSQHFASFLGGAQMAHELYILGCEIPMSEIMPGDMLFFRSTSLSDAQFDTSEWKSFRNISHLAICSSIEGKEQGHIRIVECGGFHDADQPFLEFGIDPTKNAATEIVHYADLANRICMVARHPAAFGIGNAVGEKFVVR